MLKMLMAGLAVLLAHSVSAQTTPVATVVPSAEIQAFIDALPKDAINDLPIRVADVGGYKVGVYGVFRPKAMSSEASLHETTVSEVYYVLQGAGTLVTGGKLVNERRTAGSTTVQGTGIEGGVSRRVARGDVVLIPNHVAHWWSSLEQDLSYLIIRPDPEGKQTLKGAPEGIVPMTTRATGTFDVKLSPLSQDDKGEGIVLGRMSIDKELHGDLEGTSKGEMMSALTGVKDSGGYVAIERVNGTLNGRSGTFVLQHTGIMTRGAQQLSITVVPDSGTGQLAGITGRMDIRIADGKHFYDFEYTLGQK